jgi:hypothetical protein
MRFAPTVAAEINKMILPRWGEFCCARHCRGRCQRLMGFALSERRLERGVEIGNMRGLGC